MVGILEGQDLKYYAGVDESNHGKYPEVFVAVSSLHEVDAIYHEEVLPKRRIHCKTESQLEKAVKAMLGCRDFRFLLANKEHADYCEDQCLGMNYLKISAMGQVVSALGLDEKTKVIVDGYGTNKDMGDIRAIIKKNARDKKVSPASHYILFEHQGDQHFPIVNIADSIAYMLFRSYSNLGQNEKGPFDEFRVKFELGILSQKRTPSRYVNRRSYYPSRC